MFDDDTYKSATIIRLLPGHYTLENLAKELENGRWSGGAPWLFLPNPG